MDETKECRFSQEEWDMLRMALNAYVMDHRYAATLNEEFRQQQDAREALQEKITKIGLFESGPFTVDVRVEESKQS